MHAICVSCHAALSSENHPAEQAECLSCHMPRSPASDIPHTAITDHRILRRPSPPIRSATIRSLRAWTDPPAEFRARDLALAEAEVGVERQTPELMESASAILEKITSAPSSADAPALSAMGGIFALKGRLWGAVDLARRAAEQQPASADYALDLGVYLQHAGDALGAERELNRAIALDPFFDRPYKALFDLLSQQERPEDALRTLDRYLKQNPKSIEFRMERADAASPSPR
jgi:tetratricopeptide (TPR) repeat protein